jgi:hypothetical protein
VRSTTRWAQSGALISALTCALAFVPTHKADAEGNLAKALRRTGKGDMNTGYLYRGRTEYGLFGNFNISSPSSQDVSIRYAPMLSDRLQWGIDFSYHNNGGSYGSVAGLGNYYFGQNDRPTRPYLGVAVGTTFGDMGDCLEWGAQGGVKHFVSPNVALTGELQFRRMGDMDWSGALLGLSYFGGPSLVGEDFTAPGPHTTEWDLFGDADFDEPRQESLNVRYAPFFADKWQWGVEFGIRHQSDFTGGNIGGLLNYYPSLQSGKRTQPYLGVGVDTTWGDFDEVVSYGPHVGIKHFLTSDVALFAQLNLRWADINGDNKERTTAQVGFAFYP